MGAEFETYLKNSYISSKDIARAWIRIGVDIMDTHKTKMLIFRDGLWLCPGLISHEIRADKTDLFQNNVNFIQIQS